MPQPNVLLVLVDDMGFGASSPYGGPCRMPTAERLAAEGLRYTRFHVTSLCSPTRQALLTGRNNHSVGMGATTEMATMHPGYNGLRPASAATMGQLLGQAGYRTAAFGKWHQTPPSHVGPEGPFTYWPKGEGFDYFYGFMACEMNHWFPLLYEGTTPVEPPSTPEEGYHLTEDLVDHVVDWLGEAAQGDQPFFGYLALGATHAPFHVRPEWVEEYAGAFDDGWDAQRERTLARQIELGVVPPDTELAPWPEGLPHWDSLDDTGRRVAARFMETYAAFATHADEQVGRIIDRLDELGLVEDTLVVYILGDNGASGEGGVAGTLHEHLVGHGIGDDTESISAQLDQLGGPGSYPIYPAGWAAAMNTPYQWTKQIASHYGGTRDGAVVRWPAQVPGGELRHQWHHVIDVLPTVLEAAGVAAPDDVGGVAQQPIEGTSMTYSFVDPAAPERRRTQYFETVGNRAIYHEGWVACARHGVPWEMTAEPRSFDEDRWELYDTTVDWSQTHDIAEQHPERLAELKRIFDAEAERYQVLPLDDRVTERENAELAGRHDPRAGRLVFDYGPADRRIVEELAPNVKNRSHRIGARVRVAEGDRGVIVAQGGRFGGWSLHLHGGRLTYAYNLFGRELTSVRAEVLLAAGEYDLGARFDYQPTVEGEVGGPASVTLEVDGVQVGHGIIGATTAYYFTFDETFDVGVDLGTPVSDDFLPGHTEFSGTIEGVRIELSPTRPLDEGSGDCDDRPDGAGPPGGRDFGAWRANLTHQ